MSEFVHVVYQSPFVQLIGLLKGNILKGAAYAFKKVKYKMNCLIVNKHKKSLSILFFSPLIGVITIM